MQADSSAYSVVILRFNHYIRARDCWWHFKNFKNVMFLLLSHRFLVTIALKDLTKSIWKKALPSPNCTNCTMTKRQTDSGCRYGSTRRCYEHRSISLFINLWRTEVRLAYRSKSYAIQAEYIRLRSATRDKLNSGRCMMTRLRLPHLICSRFVELGCNLYCMTCVCIVTAVFQTS